MNPFVAVIEAQSRIKAGSSRGKNNMFVHVHGHDMNCQIFFIIAQLCKYI